MKTEKFGTMNKDKKVERGPLQEFVTLINAVRCGIYKKSFSRHVTHEDAPPIDEQISQEDKDKIKGFMDHYKMIHDRMFEQKEREQNERIPFNNPGKFLSMVIMDYNDTRTTMETKVDMWVNILNIERCSENFMKGKSTLWNELADADRRNQEESNIEARLDRVRGFYNDKGGTSEELRIVYTEP
jgi:hypothetical protein